MDKIDNYYKRKEKIIVKLYDTLTKWACEELEAYISDTQLNKFEMAIKAEYSSIINGLPYIGGRKNAFTGIIVINGWYVCAYRALREDMPILIVWFQKSSSTKCRSLLESSLVDWHLGKLEGTI